MNHKLRVLVRVDLGPGRVTVEAGVCLIQANLPVLLQLMLRAQRVATGHLAGRVEVGNAA